MTEISIKAMLKWLDGQRDAANARIIAAPPGNQGRYMPELQVINAIAERVQEMTAVEYLIEMSNILRTYCDNGSLSCGDCPLLVGEKKGRCAQDYITKNPRNIVEIVKKWKEEQDESV